VTTVTRVSDARTRCTTAELVVRMYTASSVVHLQAGKREMIASVSLMSYKSSAAAEMGDRARAEKLGAAVPLSRGELCPHLTQCGLYRGLPLYQVAS